MVFIILQKSYVWEKSVSAVVGKNALNKLDYITVRSSVFVEGIDFLHGGKH